MTILTIHQLEKRAQNTIFFPAFDLKVKKGETVAIHCNSELGNKLIRILIGELLPSSGEVNIQELANDRQAFFQRIGLSLQTDALYERLSPKGYLTFFKKLYAVHVDVDNLLEKTGLIDKKNIRSDKLSYSEKRRLHFARAILHDPNLIIFEDPAQNLDIESTLILHRLISNLEDQGKAIFITTSNLENAISMTNHVYRLDDSGLKKVDLTDENEEPVTEEAKAFQEETENEINMEIRFDKIPAKVEDKLILFDPTEIDYIESNNGISNLNVKGETFPCTFKLNDLDARLQPFGFFRCHRSYIVNLQKVREVITWTRNSYSLILDDQKKSSIPLSKGKLDELKNIIGI
ncbi:LytTR family transcriptional regulator DNA-binding domain-containing protein [Lederbergia citrea]|uniref:LytTR family transcriptional regulator DNA-binding domain-containing protein n=1 Tax=Lederbergia citrea TaxID=2833581 RepID=UPI001BC9B225|nr:LytTR family transcriptional regulator DNA-binding domain-containing protein [Lederbergia citrea]MBS4204657.1 LytTR family transcriptional regulator DNA-binding domain-containing protein [Lederbergia citrea]